MLIPRPRPHVARTPQSGSHDGSEQERIEADAVQSGCIGLALPEADQWTLAHPLARDAKANDFDLVHEASDLLAQVTENAVNIPWR